MNVNYTKVQSSLIDSHCHLDFGDFDSDREAVIKNAKLNGISDIIIPGVCQSRWDNLIALCETQPNLHFALGCHPYFLKSFNTHDLSRLEQLASTSACLAIGECGIDSTIDNIQLQTRIFVSHIEIANRLKMPMIVHHRKSHHLLLSAFKVVKPLYGGVIHAFSGNIVDAMKYIKLGFKLGIGGTISYTRATKTQDVVRQVSLSDILLETDSPDMPLYGRQGKRNEPQYVLEIANMVAKLKNTTLETVAETTTYSAKTLFNL